MRCTECGSTMPLAAEFCPECGVARSPGLRVRRGEARERLEAADPDPKRVRRTILIAGAALLFGIVIGNQTSGGGFGRAIDIDPAQWQKRPAVISADEFFDAYRKDEDDADSRFANRGIVVTGEFVRINKDDQGTPDLRLKTSDPDNPLGADLLPDSYERSALLKPGETVTVSCERVRQTGEEHWLRNCSIEDTTLALPAPVAAAHKAEASPAAKDNGNTIEN